MKNDIFESSFAQAVKLPLKNVESMAIEIAQ